MAIIMPVLRQAWDADGVPGDVITLGQGGILYLYDQVVDTTTGKLYRCMKVGDFDGIDTYTGCVFEMFVTETISVVETLGKRIFKQLKR